MLKLQLNPLSFMVCNFSFNNPKLIPKKQQEESRTQKVQALFGHPILHHHHQVGAIKKMMRMRKSRNEKSPKRRKKKKVYLFLGKVLKNKIIVRIKRIR